MSKSPKSNPMQYSAIDLGFNQSMVSKGSLDVVKKLQRAGYDGYLVGGCVRDLILGTAPKDFDVTTNATPEEVKAIFHRGRIIGRRFKIVHVRYGREIVEISTYRAAPGKPKKNWFGLRKKTSDSQRVLDDNVYGTLDEDVVRRDFTVNALYYNPVEESVLDFVEGISDAGSGILRMIGSVPVRFGEDPVHMLRVVRFKAKLSLTLVDEVEHEIRPNVVLLGEVPPARLFDEVLKLFHHAHGVRSWEELKKYSILDLLFPLTMKSFDIETEVDYEKLVLDALGNTDRRINQGKPVIPAFLFAALLWAPFKREYEAIISSGSPLGEAMWSAGDRVFEIQNRTVSVPRRVSGPAIEIWSMQNRLVQRRPRTIDRLLENRRFRAAYDFLLLRAQCGEVDTEVAQWWTDIQECDSDGRRAMIDGLRDGFSKSSRRAKSKNGVASDPGANSTRRKRPRNRRSKKSVGKQ